jgi:hypothetical protein
MVVFERSARCTFKGTCTAVLVGICPMLKGQCLQALDVSSVYVSDQQQNKYKYHGLFDIWHVGTYLLGQLLVQHPV